MVTIALPSQRPAFVDILSIQRFRLLWLSNGLSFMGMRIQDMAVAWLVLEMTDSNLWVGVVNGLPALSIVIFSLLGGILADRTDKRRLRELERQKAMKAYGDDYENVFESIQGEPFEDR